MPRWFREYVPIALIVVGFYAFLLAVAGAGLTGSLALAVVLIVCFIVSAAVGVSVLWLFAIIVNLFTVRPR